jgi:hypothetical protein
VKIKTQVQEPRLEAKQKVPTEIGTTNGPQQALLSFNHAAENNHDYGPRSVGILSMQEVKQGGPPKVDKAAADKDGIILRPTPRCGAG